MILANLPALQVVIPLFGALLCVLLRLKNSVWTIAAITIFATCACSIAILINILENGPILYVMGGWTAPFGIEYRIDNLSALFLLLISVTGSFAIIYGLPSILKEIKKVYLPYFYGLFLLLFAGLLGIVATNDVFNIYVFLEISSLATYALVAMGKDRRALIAAFEYLIMATIGATFILIAVGLLYSMTGSLNITDIAQRLPNVIDALPVKLAMAFFTIGLALKIAIFPLHLWLVNAYTNAPSFITIFLSATATKVGIYILIRLLFFVFGVNYSLEFLPLDNVLIFLGVLAMLVASLIAIMQDNIKRMLAYSSIAQIGYILVGIGIASKLSLTASLLHVSFHALAKASMFMAVGAVLYKVSNVRIEQFKGIGKIMPVTIIAFIIGGLSLIGVPGTAGFISKWYLLNAALEAKIWPVFIAILFSSLLTLTYIWKVIEVAFFQDPSEKAVKAKNLPKLMLLPMVIFSILTIILGIFPSYVNLFIGQIVSSLF